MVSNIWKVCQETNAQQMYENVKNANFFNKELNAVKSLTNICNQISDSYDEILDDQNEYLFELENDTASLDALKEDVDQKIKALFEEIKALDKKEKDGTITEEEKQELENKRGELSVLMKDSDEKINNAVSEAKAKGDEKINQQKSKVAVAKNYGEVTLEKGKPLADTKVSHGFFKKLFGSTGKNKKVVGEKAVEAGNNLLDKVSESTDINAKIEKGYKNIRI